MLDNPIKTPISPALIHFEVPFGERKNEPVLETVSKSWGFSVRPMFGVFAFRSHAIAVDLKSPNQC